MDFKLTKLNGNGVVANDNGIINGSNTFITKPSTEISRVYREVMSYVLNNGGTLLNRSHFENLFPFLYFDLRKLKDDEAQISFHYKLSGKPNADYNIYATALHEKLYHS